MMMTAGEKTPVGLVWSSRLVSLVFTPDRRLYAAFATPDSLKATVAADEAIAKNDAKAVGSHS
jgi:hypothetical protein